MYFGDNLEVLREYVATGSVDLVYLDPPFNSNRNYNVIFTRSDRLPKDNLAQIQAFDDTWRWSPVTEQQYHEMLAGAVPSRVADVVRALHALLGENDAMAYLVNMAPRLVELHRVLKTTASLYLHCDPTMSHYLKVLLDAIFGAHNFRDEIVWKRHNARSVKQSIWPRLHDVILYYGKSSTAYFAETRVSSGVRAEPHDLVRWDDGETYRTKDLTGQGTRQGETGKPWRDVDPTRGGRHWRVMHAALDAMDAEGRIHWQRNGMPRERALLPYVPDERQAVVGDVWNDIDSINAGAAERLGYPTQKPVSLLQRIVAASSRPGDVVLDPFCGCGTTIDAAVTLEREWIGIDVTYIAVDLIRKRLQHTFGESISTTYDVTGIPRDMAGARQLFARSAFEFERWAVSLVGGTPNQKQVGDRGIDGVVRFYTDAKGETGRVLVSVKGGKSLGPQFVRDLIGTVQTERAEMGSLLTLSTPTRGIYDAVAHAGAYHWPITGGAYPRAQVLTVEDLLAGQRMQAPPALVLPYIPAGRHKVSVDQLRLL